MADSTRDETQDRERCSGGAHWFYGADHCECGEVVGVERRKPKRANAPQRRHDDPAQYLDFKPSVPHPLGANLGPAAIAPRRRDPTLAAEIVRLLEKLHGVNWLDAVREAAGLMAMSIEEVEEWWAFDTSDVDSPSYAEMIRLKREQSAALMAEAREALALVTAHLPEGHRGPTP